MPLPTPGGIQFYKNILLKVSALSENIFQIHGLLQFCFFVRECVFRWILEMEFSRKDMLMLKDFLVN